MKHTLFLLLFIFISITAYSKTQLGASLSVVDRDKMPVQDLVEDDKERLYRSWNTHLEICWKDSRASFCDKSQEAQSRQRLDFKCTQSMSATCPDAHCEVLGKNKIDDVTILKGNHRDFLFVRGSQSGCGGISYNINVVDMKSEIRCSFSDAVALSGDSEDEAAEKLLGRVYKNPQKYIRWINDKCEFHLSKKELAILKKKQ